MKDNLSDFSYFQYFLYLFDYMSNPIINNAV